MLTLITCELSSLVFREKVFENKNKKWVKLTDCIPFDRPAQINCDAHDRAGLVALSDAFWCR